MESADPLDALHALLDAEYRLVRTGGLARAAGLAEEKRRLAERLAQMRPAGDRVAALRARAERNEAMLAAALRGQAAARQRLAALRQAASQLDTYDRDGRPQTLGRGPGLSRRA
ncbi:flagellar biosynthesis/type III secretory pathway chaperone [Rhodovulum iodosum]|uniref:Flagellar biosynthesis/type III secretory pathway chaperone n=1 Tax=Rhodovulum iodosum TaxID=68291 RepID=A0ABV3XRR8_9RHOB|nr:hypothetical protein [Rhodovulum robiginosum]RSK40012.1 hypothetical protein EJA01_00710 [Rhodovulum robiginosum]